MITSVKYAIQYQRIQSVYWYDVPAFCGFDSIDEALDILQNDSSIKQAQNGGVKYRIIQRTTTDTVVA